MSDLKPCPFCGEHGTTTAALPREAGRADREQLVCSACGARGPVSLSGRTPGAYAADVWGIRTPPASGATAREAVMRQALEACQRALRMQDAADNMDMEDLMNSGMMPADLRDALAFARAKVSAALSLTSPAPAPEAQTPDA